MIVAATVCPATPLLFQELSGERDVVADLRAACLEAVRTVVVDVDVVVVVGGAEATRTWSAELQPNVRRFGGRFREGRQSSVSGLPLSLGVGRRLLEEAGWRGRTELLAVEEVASAREARDQAAAVAGRNERVALLVMGEGSARRGEKAPGFLDERAFDFDAVVGQALGNGDLATLLDMDPGLARELMVSGRAPFQVLACAIQSQGSPVRARTAYADDPFGVMYFVALWLLGSAP